MLKRRSGTRKCAGTEQYFILTLYAQTNERKRSATRHSYTFNNRTTATNKLSGFYVLSRIPKVMLDGVEMLI